MTKHGWGPVLRENADGTIEQVRAPTKDELSALSLKLARWHHAHPYVISPKLWEELAPISRNSPG